MPDPISVDAEVMGGTPVFRGTRVPVSTLFDYLRDPGPGIDPIQEFLDNFPSVTAQQIAEVLQH
jgi:uncharacterized protein (DUF433 family)